MIGFAYNKTVTANNGTGTLNLAVVETSHVAGFVVPISGTTSVAITGTPTATGTETFTVTATDSLGSTTNTTYNIAVNSPVTLSPSTLPPDTVGNAYNKTITANNGTAPNTLTVVETSHVAGLVVPSSGISSIAITGTPTASGTETFSVTATDAVGSTTNTTYNITVNPAITLAPGSLPADTVGVPYNQTITASNGTGTLNLVVTETSHVTGLTVPTSGTTSIAVTGTPTAAGTETFKVVVTDAAGGTTMMTYSFAVNAVATFNPATLPNGATFVPYNQTITAINGTGTKTLVVSSPLNPIPGLVVPSGGSNSIAITGSPTAIGTETFTVTATDALGVISTANFSITVVNSALIVTPLQLAAGKVGVPYNQSFTATNGTGPYSFNVSAGSLPAGLSLVNGVLVGTPTAGTAGGTFSFTIQATDSASPAVHGHQAYTLVVNPPTFVFGTLPLPVAGANYSATIGVTGSTAPFHGFAVTSGVLPTGLMLNPTTGALTGVVTASGTFNFTVSVTDSSTGAGPYTQSHAYSKRGRSGARNSHSARRSSPLRPDWYALWPERTWPGIVNHGW